MMSRPYAGGQQPIRAHHVYQVPETNPRQRADRPIQLQYSDPSARNKFDVFAVRCYIVVVILFSINILTSISMTIFVISTVRIDRNGLDSSSAAELDDDGSVEAGSPTPEIGWNSWKACVACGVHASQLERIGWKRQQQQQQICCTEINENFCNRVNKVGNGVASCSPYAAPLDPKNTRREQSPRVRVPATGLYLVYSTATFPCVRTTKNASHKILVRDGRTLASDRRAVAASGSSPAETCYTSRLLLTTSLEKDETVEVVTTLSPYENRYSVKTNLRLHRVG